MSFVVSYVSTALVMLVLDALWLGTMTSRLYRPMIGGLMAEQPNMPAAVLFYLLYVAGIVVFAVQPALDTGRWTSALMLGAFLGLVAYGTYDLTNQATLRDWPALITVIDLAWGTLLTGVAATAGMLITRYFVGSAG
ncbi:DUF2177 family protein [Starkeya koreensis]|uniref:DUF2177 family protein n=1 Tax=Ancylobacter koreensis TaxID=266121 RepID=A0ABT0DMM2_9HYPH|nr:DUF2177 family protein [Ancylobacter koreensis]MCK0208522.1 DUF2177 family protein [Ancylobacter koreensis]